LDAAACVAVLPILFGYDEDVALEEAFTTAGSVRDAF
jgi:hypothetical protein